MAMKIVDECISCGACEPECPNEAIAAADPIFVVDAERCTECVGAFEKPRCIEVCPVDSCIIPDPALVENRADLEAKFSRLHA